MQVLANLSQLVKSDLFEPEQNYTVKGRSIQDNLHLMCKILEGLKDGTEAELINLDQSKAFDKVDHRFVVTVLETAKFQSEFCKWINMMYHNPQAMVQVNGESSRAFMIEWSVRQGCLLSPLLYVLALKPLLRRLRDEKASLALCCILYSSPLSAKVSAYVDDLIVFGSHRLDIKAVKKVVARYEQVAGAKINFSLKISLGCCKYSYYLYIKMFGHLYKADKLFPINKMVWG